MRNNKVFENISENAGRLLFNTKMRALVWLKSSLYGSMINTEGWWSKPFDESQRDQHFVPLIRSIRSALFFGPTRVLGRDLAELIAARTILELSVTARPSEGWSLLLDIDKATRLIRRICFRYLDRDDNATASLLAMEGLLELNCFRHGGKKDSGVECYGFQRCISTLAYNT
ncbi:hypothetical protein V6N12_056666 [Hibiscus sabdariffa]|uniref:Uncharacterized protein n=1 Tax=Hibiscus sabdariffa TaxID=183260 RepID=A0ABR2AKX3_9ROSI